MNTDWQFGKVKIDDELKDLFEKKVHKLTHFYDHIYDSSIFFKDEGPEEKVVEIKVNVKNNTLFCSEKENSFEKALDSCVEAMKRSLKRYKSKLQEK